MSIQNMETFGETIRRLRENNDMPLRKLAALLDIDQSTLSKIERNERNANPGLIDKLSKKLKVDKKQLQISYYSDKVAYDLVTKEDHEKILIAAEEKIKYMKLKGSLSK
jgi:HTH-type transcriptional regulator, competence development regulator